MGPYQDEAYGNSLENDATIHLLYRLVDALKSLTHFGSSKYHWTRIHLVSASYVNICIYKYSIR